MRSRATTTERRIDFRDLTELEARVLYSMVNWNGEKVKRILESNEGVWEDYAEGMDGAHEVACNVRDEIFETVLPE